MTSTAAQPIADSPVALRRGLRRSTMAAAARGLVGIHQQKQRKEKFTLFSDHNGRLLRRSPEL